MNLYKKNFDYIVSSLLKDVKNENLCDLTHGVGASPSREWKNLRLKKTRINRSIFLAYF